MEAVDKLDEIPASKAMFTTVLKNAEKIPKRCMPKMTLADFDQLWYTILMLEEFISMALYTGEEIQEDFHKYYETEYARFWTYESQILLPCFLFKTNNVVDKQVWAKVFHNFVNGARTWDKLAPHN